MPNAGHLNWSFLAVNQALNVFASTADFLVIDYQWVEKWNLTMFLKRQKFQIKYSVLLLQTLKAYTDQLFQSQISETNQITEHMKEFWIASG